MNGLLLLPKMTHDRTNPEDRNYQKRMKTAKTIEINEHVL